MEKKNKKKRKKKIKIHYGRFSLFILVLLVCFYGLFRLIMSWYNSQDDLYPVYYESLAVRTDTKALVLRNEALVTADISGNLHYFVEEGSVVSAGDAIAEIISDGQQIVEDTIDYDELEAQNKFDQINYEISNLYNDILVCVHNEAYSDLAALNYRLKISLETKEKMAGTYKFLSNRENQYNLQVSQDKGNIAGSKKRLVAPVEGVITTYLTGYEDLYSISHIYEIPYDQLSSKTFSMKDIKKETVKINQPIYKIVDQTTLNFAVIIDFEDIETYKTLEQVGLEINGELLNCKIIDVFSHGDKGILWLKTPDYKPSFLKATYLDATLVKENYQGLKISKDSVIHKENQVGVYRLGPNRNLEFVPIEVIVEQEGAVMISADKFYIKGQGLIRTLSVGDKVVKNANNHHEGEQINDE